MRQQQMVGRLKGTAQQGQSRRVDADRVPVGQVRNG